jgi:BASS family bile acid:Na+ symporter
MIKNTHPLQVLDTVKLNFSEGSLLIMNITIALVMFGVALNIKPVQFKEVAKSPKPIIIGVLSQYFVLPFLTYILVLIIKPTPSVALGMILVASCPGGNISNFISSMAKANVPLSVTLTAISTLLATLMTPVNFSFWGKLFVTKSHLLIPIEIDFFQMLKTVFILLGMPVIIGMLFAYKFPKLTDKINKPMKIISIIIFFGYVIAALSANFGYFLKYIHLILLIVLLHNGLGLAGGYIFSRIFKLSEYNCRTISIETGIQNSGLGLVLIFNPKLFNGVGGMAFIAAWWGIWHIISGMLLAWYWSKRKIAISQ